ncbi:hypothetical protein LCGC14_0819740 [marine sediment metagenome]|uniref:Uncharacterized protein n=1 Tax=marine sediment metagenome TaxID=412755 RepID=A0A0F9PJ64_9ZZZZ
MTIPEKLAAIRERLEQRTVECKEGGDDLHLTTCVCNGWMSIPDPAFAPLMEVVRVEKPCPHSELIDDVPVFYKPKQCPGCHGKPRYTTRSIEGWPKGALAGAIEWNMPPHWTLKVYRMEGGDYWAEVFVWEEGKKLPGRFLSKRYDTPDPAAGDALFAALSAQTPEEGRGG